MVPKKIVDSSSSSNYEMLQFVRMSFYAQHSIYRIQIVRVDTHSRISENWCKDVVYQIKHIQCKEFSFDEEIKSESSEKCKQKRTDGKHSMFDFTVNGQYSVSKIVCKHKRTKHSVFDGSRTNIYNRRFTIRLYIFLWQW